MSETIVASKQLSVQTEKYLKHAKLYNWAILISNIIILVFTLSTLYPLPYFERNPIVNWFHFIYNLTQMVVVIWSMGNHTKLTRLLFNLQRLQAQLSIFFILDLYFVIYYFFLSIKGKTSLETLLPYLLYMVQCLFHWGAKREVNQFWSNCDEDLVLLMMQQ